MSAYLLLNKKKQHQQPLKRKLTGPIERAGNFIWLKWIKDSFSISDD